MSKRECPVWVEQTVQDLRYAQRGLRRNPGLTLTAVLAAAIETGASTAVLSTVDRILFRPLRTRASPNWSAYMNARA